MIEKKIIQISDKIIKSENVRKLLTDIVLTVNNYISKDIKDSLRYKIILKASDSSEFESTSLEILDAGEIIDTKQITSINFSLNCYDKNISINLDLNHSINDYKHENFIRIEGGDSLIVGGLLKIINENVDTWEKQKTIIKKNKALIVIIITICLSMIYYKLFIFFIKLIIKDNIISSSSGSILGFSFDPFSIFIYISSILGTVFISFSIYDWMEKLWPNLEFQMGKEYFHLEKIRRLKLWIIISVILIPTIISLFT